MAEEDRVQVSWLSEKVYGYKEEVLEQPGLSLCPPFTIFLYLHFPKCNGNLDVVHQVCNSFVGSLDLHLHFASTSRIFFFSLDWLGYKICSAGPILTKLLNLLPTLENISGNSLINFSGPLPSAGVINSSE